MNITRPLIATLALVSVASAARSPANLEAFKTDHVCVGRAEILVRGQADTKLTQLTQDTLSKLAASLKLNGAGESYTDCPAWLSFQAQVGSDGNGQLVYAATLSLVTPKVQVKALENLESDSFPYDGDFEYVTLWSQAGANVAPNADNLAFRLRAELVSQMNAFGQDWKKTH